MSPAKNGSHKDTKIKKGKEVMSEGLSYRCVHNGNYTLNEQWFIIASLSEKEGVNFQKEVLL